MVAVCGLLCCFDLLSLLDGLLVGVMVALS